jgi:hypothetical protein
MQPGILSADLVATGQLGPLALLASPGLERLGRVVIDLDGFDYGDGSGPVPIGLDLPGVLQFGGLPVSLALAAPRAVLVHRPAATFERMWAENAYGLAGAWGQVAFSDEAPTAGTVVRWLTEGP